MNTINPNPNPTLNRVFFPHPTSRKSNPPLNPKSSSLHFSPNPSSCNSQISAMALHLCRPKHRFPNNPSLIHLFSTSPDDNDDKEATQTTPTTTNKISLDSYFSDVKASLMKQKTTYRSSSSLEEIRKNLTEYRRRSAPPPPSPPPPTGESTSAASQPQPLSFQELYRRNQNLNQNSEVKPGSGKPSFEAIRESLRQMRANSNMNTNMNDNRSNMNAGSNADSLSMFAFRNSLKSKGQDGAGGSGSRVIGGTPELPLSVFGREMKEGKKGGEREREGMKTEFVKMYSYMELGQKLRQLRPEGWKSGEGFSLQDLNERLMRLRELEEKESESRIGGVPYRELRESLQRLKLSGEEKQKKSSVRLDILGHIGGTPTFMLHPPKEHLVEKYFHPDNMSSAEKMKIGLAKVREEFKMSESDCGSARVQVAQLTTKIKHLSSVLHKRDKHSLKGLHAMVQKRKRFLKYLRRTDWDSYCFVLSKLGLRDNPDYKA